MQDDLSGIAASLTSSDRSSISKSFFSVPKALVLRAYVHVYLRNQAYHKHFVGAYHLSLTDETKRYISHSFSSSIADMRCSCSTVAFSMVAERLSARELILHCISQNVCVCHASGMQLTFAHAPTPCCRHIYTCSYAMLHDHSELHFVHVQAKEHNERTRWKDQATRYVMETETVQKIPKDLVWILRRHKK